MPTGWRPEDVQQKFPVNKIENPYSFEKYYPKVSNAFTWWSWVQFFSIFGLLTYLFASIAELEITQLFIYGAFVYLCIYAMTEAMDKNKYAVWLELGKNFIGVILFYRFNNWFGIEKLSLYLPYLILFYFVFSTLGTLYFHSKEISTRENIKLI